MQLIWVFIGGGLGALLRYFIGLLLPLKVGSFPWATLAANVLAACLVGIIISTTSKLNDPQKYLFLITGFCGGLSTFSTFSLETLQLFQRGETLLGLFNILLNILLSFWAVWLLAQQTSASQ
jgi:fluoride exporter